MEIVQWGREAKGIDTSRNYTPLLPEYTTCIGIIANRGATVQSWLTASPRIGKIVHFHKFADD